MLNWMFPWSQHSERKRAMSSYSEWEGQQGSVVTVQETKEPTVREDISAMEALLRKIVNRAVESTDLAKRVEDLTAKVEQLQSDIRDLDNELQAERQRHRETSQELSHVQQVLSQRETTIHDLMEERDIVVRERDEARQDRDVNKQQIAHWEQAHGEVFAKLTAAEQEKQRLQEQLDAAMAKIKAINDAFGALRAA